jgi:long-chain acyl-CoA synthetase
MEVGASDLVLARVSAHEQASPHSVYMTQPMGNGVVREYTWSQMMEESRRVAAYLQSFGFPPGSKIAILSKNCAHFVMSDLAIWMAGYVSVALYPTLNADTIRFILEHSESRLIFVGKLDGWDDMRSGVPDTMPHVSYPLSPPNDYPSWDELVEQTAPIADASVAGPRLLSQSPLAESAVRSGDQTALLVYTSGSTGKPKGVEHSFKNLAAAAKGLSQALSIRPSDRMLSYLPLAHVFERCAIEIMSLYVGNPIWFAESLDSFVADIQRCRPTIFHSVPRLWLKFQQGVFSKLPEARLDRLLKVPFLRGAIKRRVLRGLGLHKTRLAISGSAPIPPELIEWYRELNLELLEGYAMSENFAYSHVSLPGKSRVGYVGNALPAVEHRISPEGEILVKSPADMKGYFKEPELTRASYTEDGFLKTGDRGEIDEQGRVKITGRVKELFKTSKGKYVSPAPIENLLNADNHVELSCVTGAGQPQPYALVMLSEHTRKELGQDGQRGDRKALESVLEQLLDSVNKRIEEYEQLAFLLIVKDEWQIENGFLTPTMKLKRGMVEDHYAAQVEGWYAARKKVVWQS